MISEEIPENLKIKKNGYLKIMLEKSKERINYFLIISIIFSLIIGITIGFSIKPSLILRETEIKTIKETLPTKLPIHELWFVLYLFKGDSVCGLVSLRYPKNIVKINDYYVVNVTVEAYDSTIEKGIYIKTLRLSSPMDPYFKYEKTILDNFILLLGERESIEIIFKASEWEGISYDRVWIQWTTYKDYLENGEKNLIHSEMWFNSIYITKD